LVNIGIQKYCVHYKRIAFQNSWFKMRVDCALSRNGASSHKLQGALHCVGASRRLWSFCRDPGSRKLHRLCSPSGFVFYPHLRDHGFPRMNIFECAFVRYHYVLQITGRESRLFVQQCQKDKSTIKLTEYFSVLKEPSRKRVLWEHIVS
jgi:hypothetical protein